MNYKDFNIAVKPDVFSVEFKNKTFSVRSWLPTAAKIEFIQFVIGHTMNPDHGTFSPAVIDCFETIAYIKYFTDIEWSGVTGMSKGENNKLIMKRNNINTAVYVGDTIKDKESADVAGIPFIFARYGFGQVDEYDYVIDEFEDLLKIF